MIAETSRDYDGHSPPLQQSPSLIGQPNVKWQSAFHRVLRCAALRFFARSFDTLSAAHSLSPRNCATPGPAVDRDHQSTFAVVIIRAVRLDSLTHKSLDSPCLDLLADRLCIRIRARIVRLGRDAMGENSNRRLLHAEPLGCPSHHARSCHSYALRLLANLARLAHLRSGFDMAGFGRHSRFNGSRWAGNWLLSRLLRRDSLEVAIVGGLPANARE